MIKNIIFDMGNVLIRYTPEAFVKRLDLGEEDSALLLERIYHSKEWTKLDDGSLSEEAYLELLKEDLPQHLFAHADSLINRWDKPLEIIPGVEEIIKDLKEKGYKLYLLSNASTRQHEYWPNIPAAKYFDGKIISADVKIVKPDARIYENLFETFSIEAKNSLFIDDSEGNIDAAKALGMDGFLFTGDAGSLRAWFEIKKVL